MTRAEIAGLFEEDTVTCHRVVNTSARQNQSVIAPEGGDHDRDCHQDHSRWAERHFHRFSRHGVRRNSQSRECIQRQGDNVSEIREQIKQDHGAATDQKGARQIASGVAYLAARESDVIPRRLSEQWTYHGDAQEHHQPKSVRGLQTRLCCAGVPSDVGPWTPPVRGISRTARIPT